MTFSKTFFINFLSGLGMFFLVAAPTLKGILFSSSIFNFLPLFLFLFVIVLQGGVKKVFKSVSNSLIPFFLLFILLSVYLYVIYFGFPDVVEFIKYIMLFLLTIIVPHVITFKALDISYMFLFAWGVFLSFKKIFIGVVFTETFHYLTLGLPIAVMVLISFFKLIYVKGFFHKLFFFVGIVIGYLALLSLLGRSPLLFPTLLIFSYFFFNLFKVLVKFKVKDVLKYLLVLIGLLIVIQIVIDNYLSSYLLNKFSEMSLGNSDSRTDALYIPAMKSIMNNPFGTGLDSANKIIGFYPHNIFLEIGMDSGFLGILFFLILIIISFKNSIKILKLVENNQTLVVMMFVFWLIFLFWNVSYDLSSAYALFSFMSVLHSYKYIQVNAYIKPTTTI